jgi:hypothetical protein
MEAKAGFLRNMRAPKRTSWANDSIQARVRWSMRFAELRGAAEAQAGGAGGFVGRHAAADVVCGEQGEMGFDFLLEVGIEMVGGEEAASFGGDFAGTSDGVSDTCKQSSHRKPFIRDAWRGRDRGAKRGAREDRLRGARPRRALRRRQQM